MRVAISGATGLIGRALASRLLEEGKQVVSLSRGPESARVPAGAEVEAWDTRSVAELVPILESADAFVHLAGENIGSGRWTRERKHRIRSSRVETTAALAQAFAACSSPPAVLLQGSAVGFYGARGADPVDESAPAGDDFLAKVCQEWEEAGASVTGLGVRRVIARTGVVFAAQGGALERILLPFRLFAGGPVGSGNQVLSWIHLDDQVRAMAHLLDEQAGEGVFNLAAPGAVTNRELARAIGRVLGRPAFLPTPGFALRLLLGEMSTLVLDGQRAVPSRLVDLGFEFRFPEVETALRDLTA